MKIEISRNIRIFGIIVCICLIGYISCSLWETLGPPTSEEVYLSQKAGFTFESEKEPCFEGAYTTKNYDYRVVDWGLGPRQRMQINYYLESNEYKIIANKKVSISANSEGQIHEIEVELREENIRIRMESDDGNLSVESGSGQKILEENLEKWWEKYSTEFYAAMIRHQIREKLKNYNPPPIDLDKLLG